MVEVLNKVRDVFLNNISRFPYRLIVPLLTDDIFNTRFTTSSSVVSNRVDDLFDVLFVKSFYYNGRGWFLYLKGEGVSSGRIKTINVKYRVYFYRRRQL